MYALDVGPNQASFTGNPSILDESYDRGKPVQFGQETNEDIVSPTTDLIHESDGCIRETYCGRIRRKSVQQVFDIRRYPRGSFLSFSPAEYGRF